MLPVEDHYYKINRILLKIIGLWPYRTSTWVHLQYIFIISMYLSAIFVQLAVFVTHEYTLDLMIEVLSFVFPSIYMLFMYCLYYLSSDRIKTIMERIYYDWQTLKDKVEFNIMDDYTSIVSQLTEIFACFLCIVILSATSLNAVPMVLDTISPLNKSRVHMHITVEYFIDPSKYCYLFILHLSFCIFLGATTITSTGLAFFGYVIHASAMLKIANYRMQIIMDENVLRIPSPKREHIIYERIACAVKFHHRTIQYCNFLLCFEKACFLIIIIGVISLSINMFRLLKAITNFTEIMDIFISLVVVFAHFCLLFFGNHLGQQITNNDAEIFNTVYSLPWYIAPLNIQKLLLFLLQKGRKNIYFTIGGVFIASYEGFAVLTKLSISYFTVIYTIH